MISATGVDSIGFLLSTALRAQSRSEITPISLPVSNTGRNPMFFSAII
jgi:hypothetical protein